MRVARLRCFVWMLILVLSAGLSAPAFASLSDASCPDQPALTHVHADGAVHTHAAVPASTITRGDVAVWPTKAPPHCPGCATAAECAVACFGVAVLPSAIVPMHVAASQSWTPVLRHASAGASPFSDLEPPRPVSIR